MINNTDNSPKKVAKLIASEINGIIKDHDNQLDKIE
jgi:hypothetical protein